MHHSRRTQNDVDPLVPRSRFGMSPPELSNELNWAQNYRLVTSTIQNISGLPQAFVYSFAVIRRCPAACILCWQNQGLLFHCVRTGSLSAAHSVATALRRTEQKRCRKWLVVRD